MVLAKQIGRFLERLNNMAKNPIIRILSPIFVGKKLIDYYHERMGRVEFALAEAEKGIDMLFWGAIDR